MRGYIPGEQPRGNRIVKLNTNENPYPPSPRVREAVLAATGSELRLYPDPAATRLRAAAAAVYGLEPEQVLAGNGSDELLSIIMRACVEAGDTVAYPVPTYTLYDTLVQIQEGRATRVPFAADFSLPAALADTGARLTIVCNPNSPSGTVVPAAALAQLARGVGGLLVIDEAYVDFASENALPLLARHDNIVILRTLSKSYSLAGLRLGFALGPPAVLEQLLKVKDSYNVSRLSMAAGIAALEDQEWMRHNADRIRNTRARLTRELRRRGYQVPPSGANFVLARRSGSDQQGVYEQLKQRGVLVRHFRNDGLTDALRISVGTEREIDRLLEAMDAIDR